jgi:hypothetical protein
MIDDVKTEPPRRKSRIVWILVVVAILILSAMVVIFYSASRELVPVIKVVVEAEIIDGNPVIKSIEFSQETVSLTQEPVESESHLPGIYVIAFGIRSGQEYFQPFTEWTSTNFHGNGKYTLIAPFQFKPDKGNELKIQVNIVNSAGHTVERKEFGVVWDFEPVLESSFKATTINDTLIIENAKVVKRWIDPDTITMRTSEYFPGIYFSLERESEQINYIYSIPYTDNGNYTVQAYFIKPPKYGDNIQLTLSILDQNKNTIAKYPAEDKIWNVMWV